MSVENGYVGLSEVPSMEGLNFEATELRLGLPGLEPNLKSLASAGAKRGFSDALDGGSGKWVFAGSGGSEADGVNQKMGLGVIVKDGVDQSAEAVIEKKPQVSAPSAKAQVVGWPPIRSFRKNTMASHPQKNDANAEGKSGSECLYVKVSMDGAPYLRKVDLNTYASYVDLSSALEKMFRCFTIGQCSSHGAPSRDGLSERRLMDLLQGSEYVLTYEDKDEDWMLVGDVPWEMFTESCKRMRIMKSTDAIGLAPRTTEKSKNRN